MSLERNSTKRLRRGELQGAVLGAVAAAGILSLALAAPNATRLLKSVNPEWIIGRDPRQRIRETISKLKQKGLIEFVQDGDTKKLRLTAKGRKEVNNVMRGRQTITRPRKWDGRWRVIVFDIPEHRAGDRQRVRRLLSSLGFMRLQNSVWVHPFPCEELIVLLKTEMRLGRHLLYMIVDAIEFDAPLKEHFHLN